MEFESEEKLFESIYDGVDGHKVSHSGRRKMSEKNVKHLIYGELPFKEVLILIHETGLADLIRDARVFCDLGSGTGKIVLEFTLLCKQLSKVIGVELVKTLHDASVEAKHKLAKADSSLADKISFLNCNFFSVDFTSPKLAPDLVFMHYPMHNAEELYLELEEKMRGELKPGTVIVSAIRRLADLDTFKEVLPSKRLQCPYGASTMYIHQKI
jgi:SAM-dependent methyltransferase